MRQDRIRIPAALLALIVAGLPGCALNRQAQREIEQAFDRRDAAVTVAAYAAVPQATATRPAAAMPGDVPATQPAAAGVQAQAEQMVVLDHLRDYLLYALEHNPDVRRADQVARARAAQVAQATALDDPMLMTRTLPEPTETAGGDNYFSLGVTQQLPLPEKLDRRGRMALEAARAAIAEHEQVCQRVIGDVKRGWFQLYTIDRSLQILEQSQQVLGTLVDAAQAQVSAGQRSQADLLRAQVELASLRAEMVELRQQRVTAVAMLNMLLNRPPTADVPPVPAFGLRQTQLELERMLSLAAQRNPQLAILEHQLERDRQALRLAQLRVWPDFNIGFEWMYMKGRDIPDDAPEALRMAEEGMDNYVILFGLNLPIWYQKNEAAVREARHELAATQYEHAAARNAVWLRVQDALAQVRAQQELAALFGEVIVPQAQQAYEVSLANYRAGTSDFQFLIENWQKWLRFEIQYHRALGGLERAVADLEQAIGVSLREASEAGEATESVSSAMQ